MAALPWSPDVSRFARLKAWIVRHRLTLMDLAMIAMVVVVACFFAWQLDIFPDQSARARGMFLEVDEAMGLLALAFGLFSWSRLRAQRRETRRRIAAEAEARALAYEDPLTGLPNRRQFDQALKEALAQPPRAGAAHAVLMLDLNGFKRINDLHGHPAGDEALIQVASRLRSAVRDGDLVARLGGDEFAVLALHVAGPEAAGGLALRVLDGFDTVVEAGGSSHRIGCGVGIALAPQDGTEVETLARKADVALYRAKADDHSALRFFEPEMDRRLQERDRMERALRSATGTAALRPHFQPLVDIRTGRVQGFEALARWTDPEFGEVSPERFIPIADDCGLIGPITDALLREACAEAVRWPAEVELSFNISPIQLKDSTLGLRLMKILADTGLPPHRLEIEITESALVRDLEAAQALLGGIRDAGVKIALDDFGTGYSSLYHLRNFKLDKIKIDRSFVESMAFDRESAAIVQALIGLGSGLSLTVTAEGVETADQQAMLVEQGCRQAQGFLFSRAVPAEEALKLVAPAKAARRA
jgi:diguanylate cyclase (GGDEF)-like protein